VLAATVLLAAFPARARVGIDRILAVVGNDLITYSDVLTQAEIARRTRESILPIDGLLAASNPDDLHKRVFKELVTQRITYAEAVKLSLVDVTPEEVETAYGRLVDTFESFDQYNRFCFLVGLDQGQVKSLIRQYVVCRNYLKKKIGLQVRISLKGYYDAHHDRYGDAPFDQVQTRAEADLYQEKLQAWLTETVARAKVRIVDDAYRDAMQ